MKLSESFWKTNEISLQALFCKNQTENIRTKKVFVRYLQTNCEPYLTILVTHLWQVYLSKHSKI